MPTRRPASLFATGLVFILFLILPTSYRIFTKKTDTSSLSSELATIEKRAILAEAEVKRLNQQISNTELSLLYTELDAVEFGGVEPSGSWTNYFVILVKELNRNHADPREVNKLLNRMVAMAKKGKYFFPEQETNLEAFYRDVENLRPK